MKHANRIAFLVVVMILSAASQATAQSASDQARLEMYRWRVELARERVGDARIVAGEAREQLDNIEELLDESLEKAERYFEERAKRGGGCPQATVRSNATRTGLNGKWPTVKEEPLILLSSMPKG